MAKSNVVPLLDAMFEEERTATLSPAAQVIYIGLARLADDRGVFPWRPHRMKHQFVPNHDGDADRLFDELQDAKVVMRFDDRDGNPMGAIRNARVKRGRAPTGDEGLPLDVELFVGLPLLNSQALRKRLHDEQAGRCSYCGSAVKLARKRADSIELVYDRPLDEVGVNAESNVVGCCRDCRRLKGKLSDHNFRDEIGRLRAPASKDRCDAPAETDEKVADSRHSEANQGSATIPVIHGATGLTTIELKAADVIYGRCLTDGSATMPFNGFPPPEVSPQTPLPNHPSSQDSSRDNTTSDSGYGGLRARENDLGANSAGAVHNRTPESPSEARTALPAPTPADPRPDAEAAPGGPSAQPREPEFFAPAETGLPPDRIADEFEVWYDAYPRHVARGTAVKAYRAARRKTDAATLLAGCQRYADLQRRRGTKPEHIAHPATWLNGERWLDGDEGSEAIGDPKAVLDEMFAVLSAAKEINRRRAAA